MPVLKRVQEQLAFNFGYVIFKKRGDIYEVKYNNLGNGKYGYNKSYFFYYFIIV